MKKYELTDETIEFCGRTLHRIRALTDFGDVKKGDLGGFVENEKNLSHKGDCWLYDNAAVCNDAQVFRDAEVYDNTLVRDNASVYGNARVYDDALVCDDASVYDNAVVCGNASVHGNTLVCDNALVRDNARVYGEARISGDADISSTADYATVQGFGTEHRTTTFFKQADGNICVVCGCFNGTLDAFKKQVKETREGKTAKEYLMVADLMEYRFGEVE